LIENELDAMEPQGQSEPSEQGQSDPAEKPSPDAQEKVATQENIATPEIQQDDQIENQQDDQIENQPSDQIENELDDQIENELDDQRSIPQSANHENISEGQNCLSNPTDENSDPNSKSIAFDANEWDYTGDPNEQAYIPDPDADINDNDDDDNNSNDDDNGHVSGSPLDEISQKGSELVDSDKRQEFSDPDDNKVIFSTI
jgi:hypothetical protein